MDLERTMLINNYTAMIPETLTTPSRLERKRQEKDITSDLEIMRALFDKEQDLKREHRRTYYFYLTEENLLRRYLFGLRLKSILLDRQSISRLITFRTN